MRFAQIQNNKVHWVFEASVKPEFAPNIVIVDITDRPDVQEGWLYAEETGEFSSPVTLENIKENKIKNLESRWGKEMAKGLATSTGIKVKCEPIDLTMFEKGYKKASQNGSLPLLRDYDGKLHRDVPFEVVGIIVSELSAHVETLWARKVLLQEMAQDATTIEEIESIDWETEVG
jgi:hypothetical protein